MHQILDPMPTPSPSLLENLAELHSKNHRYQQAIHFYSIVLEKCQSSSHSDPSQIQRLFLCIIKQLLAEQNYLQALDYYLKILQFSPENPSQISAEFIEICSNVKDFPTQIHYLSQAILFLAQNPNSENYIEAIGRFSRQIGILYHLQNDKNSAVKYFEKAIEVIKSSQNAAIHFDLTEDYVRLGMVYLEKKFFEKSLGCFQEALKILLIIPKEENYQIIEKITEKIGSIFIIKQDYMNALSQYRTCLETKMKRLGLCHKELVPIIEVIGGIYMKQENFIDALRYYKQAYRMVMKTGNNEDSKLKGIYINTGEIYKAKNQSQKALKYYSKALKIVKANKELERNKEEKLKLYREIGELFHKMENYSESAKFLVKILKAESEETSSKNLEVYVKVANLYEILGKHQKAQHYLMKLFVLQKKLLGDYHLCTQATLWRLENMNRIAKEIF